MIKTHVESSDIKKITNKLSNIQKTAPSVLSTAINLTAKDFKDKLQTEARKDYTVKKQSLNSAMTLKKATKSRLYATVYVKGGTQELRSFKVSRTNYNPKNQPKTIKAAVKKLSQMKELEIDGRKAFITKFKSGHISIVQRVADARISGRNPGRTSVITKHNQALKKLFGPSIPKMIGTEANVYYRNRSYIQRLLKKHIDGQMVKMMGGKS